MFTLDMVRRCCSPRSAPLPTSPRWGKAPDSLPQRGRAGEGAVTLVEKYCAQPLPPGGGGGWGNPVSPSPCLRAAPSRGRGDGGTWFPHGHVSRPCGCAAQRRDAHALGARASRLRHGSAGTAPAPSLTLPTGGGHPAPPPSGGRLGGGPHAAHDGHLSRPCDSAAQRRDEHTVVPGRALPSHTLPPGGGDGETRFPHSSAGRGRGETRFPHPPAPAAYVHVSCPCGSRRTTPRCTCPGSAGVPPAPRLRGHGAGPLPDPPHWGRAPGSSPQRGEAGRGAERGARWSPQTIEKHPGNAHRISYFAASDIGSPMPGAAFPPCRSNTQA